MSEKRLHIAASPLSGTIYAGIPARPGVWGAKKQDVTIEALVAVAEHAILYGKPVVIESDGTPEYRITVERLTPADDINP